MKLTPMAALAALAFAPVLSAQHRPLADAPAFAKAADVWIKDALRRTENIPSLAIVVVVDDEVVLSRGYGMADREKGIAATPDALYYIASSTKSFTALAAAMMEAEGKIDLNSSLASNCAGLTFAPEVHADKVKLRELLTHTSGIANDSIAFRLAITGQHDPQTLWNLLPRSIVNSGAPHGDFDYTNTGYNIVGMILDRKLGKPWQDLLQERIFDPLGMTRTTAYASKPQREGWPVAMPYTAFGPNGMQRTYLTKHDDTMQSAGGMLTTVDDLGRWLEFQINEGKVDGKQLVSPEIVRATHARLAKVDWADPMLGREAYGLGWFHGRLHDQAVIHHGGGFAGFRTQISFMPKQRVGVAVLTNVGSMRITDLASIWAYEWWLDVAKEQRRASAGVDELVATWARVHKRRAAEVAERAARKTMLARPLATYTGQYESESLGSIAILQDDANLRVLHGRTHSVVGAYTQPETGRLELIPGRGEVIAFRPEKGEVTSISIGGDVFRKVSATPSTGAKIESRQPADQIADRAAVLRAGLDYIEGLYDVKPELIQRSVHPTLTKLGFYRGKKDQPYETDAMTYGSLVKLAAHWNKSGKRARGDAVKKVEVLDVMDATAVVKVTAVWGVDHMQLGKFDGKWQIVHILWQSHPIK